jgi:pimeloyl-ACP methyl ester carboxylesterase
MELLIDGRQAHVYTPAPSLARADGPTPACIVLVHGALNDHRVFQPLADALAATGQRVLVPDLPGHGHSPGPALASVEDMAHWLLALLDAAGLPQAVLGGHSMGSLVALQAAGQAPQRVQQLWLLGTAWPMRVAPTLLEMALAEPERAVEMIVGWSHASADAGLRGSSRTLMLQQLAANARLLHTDLLACQAYAAAETAAAAVQAAGCPVHLVLGAADQMTPVKAAQKLAGWLQAQVHSVPAGHALLAEAPAEVLAALNSALAGALKPGWPKA